MRNLSILLKLKEKTLSAIQSAAASGEIGRIRAETAKLTEIESLIERQEAINQQVQSLSDTSSAGSPPQLSSLLVGKTISPVGKTSNRKVGARRREDFVQACGRKGIRLIPKRGALYENSRGEVVGIAYASERKENAWFLGLPSQEFQHAVLICESNNDQSSAVCLPKQFIERHRTYLSESKGQVKLNVRLRSGHYFLVIPTAGSVQIDEYVNRPEHIA